MSRGDGDIRVCVFVLGCMSRGDGDIRVCVCVLGCMYRGDGDGSEDHHCTNILFMHV
jgi:hypothetical protein